MRNLNYTFVYLMLFIWLVKAGARGDFFLNICRGIADFGSSVCRQFRTNKNYHFQVRQPMIGWIFFYICNTKLKGLNTYF